MADYICQIEYAIGETRAAIIYKKKTVEYYLRRWSDNNRARPGDVFSGRVARVDKDMMAAFVNLGQKPDGLLRFAMAATAPRLVEGQMIRVKVLREAEMGKGPLIMYEGVSEAKTPTKEVSVSLEDMIAARFLGITFEQTEVNGIAYAAEEEVALKTGGFLYIEHTRAATMIDIDTGGGAKTKVSIEAAREIARQVRQRGIGGLVLIDFPNFRKKKDRADVWQTLKDCFAGDPNNVKIAPFSRFDTIELSRARTGATIAQILGHKDGSPCAETQALAGLCRLAKEARIDGGARFVLALPKDAYDWLMADSIEWRGALIDKIGARFKIEAGANIDVYKES